jgi:cytochrome c556
MRVFFGGAAVVLGGTMFLTACATTAPRMSATDAIQARQQLMKQQGAAMRAISDKMKAGQVQAVAADAQTLSETAKKIPALFPEGSLDAQTSRAKPEIWQKRADFEAYATKLNGQAMQLAEAARSGNAQATGAVVGDIGRNTCNGCHDAFRGPEIKK